MRALLLVLVACGAAPAAPGPAVDSAPLLADAGTCPAIPCALLRCDGLMVCTFASDTCSCESNATTCAGVPASCATSCPTSPSAMYCEARSLCLCEPFYCQHGGP